MKYLLPTLTGLRLSFLPCAVVKMRRRVFRASQASLFRDPENDTGSVFSERLVFPGGSLLFGRLSGLSFLPSQADRPRFEGYAFRLRLAP